MWGRTLRIVRLAGFDIKVDASWLLIAGLIVWSLATGYFAQTTPALSADWRLLLATLAMLGLFASLIFHELAHALVARQLALARQVSPCSCSVASPSWKANQRPQPASSRSPW